MFVFPLVLRTESAILMPRSIIATSVNKRLITIFSFWLLCAIRVVQFAYGEYEKYISTPGVDGYLLVNIP